MARFGKVPAAEAKAAFAAALRRGATVVEAGRESGVALGSLYRWRRLDPEFDSAWRSAAAASAGWVFEARDGSGRRLARSKRRLRFEGERRRLFLAELERSCNTETAALDTLVHPATVRRHVRRDPGFARDNRQSLERGYAALEGEAVAERAAAAERLEQRRREGFQPPPGARPPAGFDDQIRLLQLYRRRDGRLGWRKVGRRSLKRWSFDEAIALLARRMRALGLM